MIFLICEDCIVLKNSVLLNFLKNDVKRIINKISIYIFEYIGLDNNIRNDILYTLKNEINSNLTKIFFRINYFNNLSTNFYEDSDLAMIERKFIHHSFLVANIINSTDLKRFVEDSNFKWGQIYYEILLNMICLIERCYLEKSPLYLCIDISKGDIYTAYIINRLKETIDMNIIFQNKINSLTDMFISDIYSKNIDTKKLIISDFLTSKDWLDLEKEIIKVSQNKNKFLGRSDLHDN